MLQEIAEQPDGLVRTIEAERAKIARLGKFLNDRDIDLIVLVARGVRTMRPSLVATCWKLKQVFRFRFPPRRSILSTKQN